MKNIFRAIFIVFLLAITVPTWLYASGNLPKTIPVNERLITTTNMVWPALARITYQTAHRMFDKLRRMGLVIPLSPNEQLVQIKIIHENTIRVCNGILRER